MKNDSSGRPQRVRLKFCGGCNPGYDRRAVAEKIRKMVTETDEMVLCNDDDPDLVIAVCGCPTACAEVKRFAGARIVFVTGPEEIENIPKHYSLTAYSLIAYNLKA